MLKSRQLLSDEQRSNYLEISDDISEWELGGYFTLSKEDIRIINTHRRDYNKLGFATLLCVIRYTGWILSHINYIPDIILDYLSNQLQIPGWEFKNYANRTNTQYEHTKEITEIYNYKSFDKQFAKKVFDFIYEKSIGNSNSNYLIDEAIEFLKYQKVILPALKSIERIVWEARFKAEHDMFKTINNSLTTSQRGNLDRILTTEDHESKTKLAWLREIPTWKVITRNLS